MMGQVENNRVTAGMERQARHGAAQHGTARHGAAGLTIGGHMRRPTLLTLDDLAEWFDMRARREGEIARGLQFGGHYRAAEAAQAKAAVWDEAAANCREAARKVGET